MSNSHENAKDRMWRFLNKALMRLDKLDEREGKLKNGRSQANRSDESHYRRGPKPRDGIGDKRGAEIDPKAILKIQKEIYEERLRCEREAERKYLAKLRKKEEKRKEVIRWLEESENHVEPRDMKVEKKEGGLRHELVEETPNFVVGVENVELGEQTPKFDEENVELGSEELIRNEIVDDKRNEIKVDVEVQILSFELEDPHFGNDEVVHEHGDSNVEVGDVVEFEDKKIEQEIAKEERGEEKSLVVQEVELVVVCHEYKDPYIVPHEANMSLPILFKSFLQVNYVWKLQPHRKWQRKFKLHLFHVCQSNDSNLLNSWHGSRNFPFDPGGEVKQYEQSYDSGRIILKKEGMM